MKKTYLIVIILLNGIFCFSQSNPFRAHQIYWYGIDFTSIKLIGPVTKKPDFFIEQNIPSWNRLMKLEDYKFNIQKFYKKKQVTFDFDEVKERNKSIEVEDFNSPNGMYDLSQSDIERVVSTYKKENEGIGLVFIVEDFNKWKAEGSVWVTFFDCKSHQVLFTKKITSGAGGFSLRNYWANVFYETMKKSSKKLKKWEKEYNASL